MPEELGAEGSLTLVAEAQGLPSGFRGGFYPVLVSLHDGKTELVNLARGQGGGGASCDGEGLYCCRGDDCVPNPIWEIRYPSAFSGIDHWSDRQINPFGFLSSNTFPTCGWREGCLFTDPGVFEAPGLRFGKSYTARYALVLSDHETNPDPGAQADFRVTAVRKRAGTGRPALDLNFILVGSGNVAASRTEKGKANLNALTSHILKHYAQPGAGIGIGRIQVIEWGCESGGDAYEDLDDDAIPELLARGTSPGPGGGAGGPPGGPDGALNLFMVTNVRGGMAGFTILGVAGAIGGPPVNGTAASGLVFSSFGKLSSFNPGCGPGECPVESQEAQFIEMGITLGHEIGHFLGLNHLSEMNGKQHDPIPDTPICTETELTSAGRILSPRSCYKDRNPHPLTGRSCEQACPDYDGRSRVCPDAVECQFNHLMWYSGKNPGDGNHFSEDSGNILRFSPFVR